MQIFSLDVVDELKKCLKDNKLKKNIYLYKVRLEAKTNILAFSNIIFYNNKNMTLPLGMNLSKNVLVDLSKINLKNIGQKQLRKVQFINEEDDFSNINVINIEAIELENNS